MLKHLITLKKNPKFKRLKSASFFSLVSFILLFSFFVIFFCSNDIYVIAGSSHYTPASPSGNTTGNINVDHVYIEYTSEVGSCWMFDWGDGNYSDWMEVGESDTYISQVYRWAFYGVYEVRIKHRSAYTVESNWSPPLIVNIVIPPDLDSDGWNNEVEEAYGKNPEDPNEYPLDTDGDGTPDDESSDGNYSGDYDDDDDGLSDTFEEFCGSNPKDINDVIKINIDTATYYLVDIDGDEQSDILYNSQTNSHTKVKVENGITYLDTTRDGSWDHTYDGIIVARYESFPWLYVILGIVLTVIIIIFLLFKTGVFFLYEEEYVVEE